MKTVIFETETAIFKFPLTEIMRCLNLKWATYHIKEAADILDYLKSQSGDSAEIPYKYSYFQFIALDLLKYGKGYVFCKICQMEYPSTQLHSTSVGFGKNPLAVKLNVKGGVIRRLFGKRLKIGMMGGEKYLCPKDHELISVITWIT